MSDSARRTEILEKALSLPPDERLEWLRAQCAGDAELLRDVSSRLDDATSVITTADDPRALAQGRLISHYRLGDRLGAGGMGEVWQATDEHLGRTVALKFPLALIGSDSSHHRLLREARSAAALDHPAICRVFELGEANGRPFIAMELVSGETLSAHIARASIPVSRALEWGAAIASALSEAHGKGIVHRDLKPANVMVTPDARVKVMDFGLAGPLPGLTTTHDGETWTAGLTVPGTIVGTLTYMAPELLKGQPADTRSDLWALGCVLFEMLTRSQAFRGATPSEVIAGILEREPDFSRLPSDLPLEVRSLIARLLRKDPSRRIRDAGDLVLVLDDARDALRTRSGADAVPSQPAEREQPQEVVRSGVSRRQLLFGAGAAGLLGVGAGAGAGALMRPGSPSGIVPSYQRLTFRRGMIRNARFAPDQQTVLYGALWDGDVCRTFTVRPESPESSALELPASTPLSVSSSGEIALLLGNHLRGLWPVGTLARVPLAGGAPRELLENVSFADWSPDGRELAVVRLRAEGDRLEFPPGRVILDAPRGSLSFPRVSPDGNSVALFQHGLDFGGEVVIVNRSGKVTYRSPEYLELFGLAWRGDEVWFTGGAERRTFRSIHAVRPGSPPRLVARMPGNATLHDIAADGTLLIAHTFDRSEIAAHAPGAGGERNLSWLDGSMVADLSRDGSTVLFTEIGQGGGPHNSVYTRGSDGSPAVRLGDGRALALSPDGRWAVTLATLASPHLDIVPTGAGESRRLSLPGAVFRQARWSPDGRRIIVSAAVGEHDRALFEFPATGGSPRRITPTGAQPDRWAISPDGNAVAVTHRESETRIYPLDSGPVVLMNGVKRSDVLWGWIDSGLLVSETTSIEAVFVVDPRTGQREPWREIKPSDPAGIMNVGNLIVTPDGQSYAYWWHRAMSDLYVVRGVE